VRRALVVGLDGFERSLVDRLLGEGRLPNLARLRERGGYAPIATTAPAQTPVAWSTLAVGTNPGGHGIFDFLRRDPARYRPEIALHRVEQRGAFLPPRAVNRRRGTPFWSLLGEAGVPSVVIRHPCTYPPEPIEGRLLAGVGVTDLRGGFGTATVYTTDDVRPGEGERVLRVQPGRDGHLRTHLIGPPRAGGEDARLDLDIEPRPAGAHLRIEGVERPLVLEPGRWSPWVGVRFKLGTLQSVRGQVRFLLTRAGEAPTLYASPVNFDPMAPPFPISHPWDYAGELQAAVGPYHTLGMAEDHGGLNNGRFDEAIFLDQCLSVFDERRAMFRYELDRVDEGLLFCVFDTPDRLQHMWWRFLEPDHPANRAHGWDPALAEALDEHYVACDGVVGEALEAADDDTLVAVVSDHGFGSYRRQLHLNAWLRQQGLLVLRDDADPAATTDTPLEAVDWSRTRAYALGLAGVYLNLEGREAHGIVGADEAPTLASALARTLTGLGDQATGETAVRRAFTRDEVYRGPYLDDAPDVVVGCAPGYRISSATALGAVPSTVFEDNLRRWSGDHVVDPLAVPGVLFLNRPLANGRPDLVDVAPTLLAAFGLAPGPAMEGRSLLSGEGSP
jgi:predicted AlkP superfamily phosphohydrolase/phosphomutase